MLGIAGEDAPADSNGGNGVTRGNGGNRDKTYVEAEGVPSCKLTLVSGKACDAPATMLEGRCGPFGSWRMRECMARGGTSRARKDTRAVAQILFSQRREVDIYP